MENEDTNHISQDSQNQPIQNEVHNKVPMANIQEASAEKSQTPIQKQTSFEETPKPKHSKRSLLLGLTLLLVIIAIGAIYFLLQNKERETQIQEPSVTQPQESPTPTPDPTANWETYTNTKFNYSFRYPNSFSLDSNNQTDSEEKIIKLKRTVNDKETIISVSANNDNVSKNLFDSYKKDYEETASNNEPFIREGKLGVDMTAELNKTNVANYDAYFSTLKSETSVNKNVLFEKDSLIFTIQLFSDDPKSSDEFDQILTTFKFLAEESELVEYTSKALGFEIEYPSSWNLTENETPAPKVTLTTDFHSSMTAPTSTIPYQVIFYNVENKTDGKFAEYFETLKNELFMEELDFDEIAIGSHQVYKYNHSGFEYPYLYYFIPRSESQDKYLEIQVTPDPEWPIDNGDLMLEKLNSIITSLKFIDY